MALSKKVLEGIPGPQRNMQEDREIVIIRNFIKVNCSSIAVRPIISMYKD